MKSWSVARKGEEDIWAPSYRHAHQLPFQIEKFIVQLKQEHPNWGAPKIQDRLRRKHSEGLSPPEEFNQRVEDFERFRPHATEILAAEAT